MSNSERNRLHAELMNARRWVWVYETTGMGSFRVAAKYRLRVLKLLSKLGMLGVAKPVPTT